MSVLHEMWERAFASHEVQKNGEAKWNGTSAV